MSDQDPPTPDPVAEANARAEAAEQRVAALEQRMATAARDALIVDIATKLGAADPSDVVALLPADALQVDGGATPDFAATEAAVRDLLQRKPHLRRADPRLANSFGATHAGPRGVGAPIDPAEMTMDDFSLWAANNLR